jgi:flagellar biosynthesis chaperone FliJ
MSKPRDLYNIVGEYAWRAVVGALVGFISYYITFTYSLNFDLALLSMGIAFVLGLLLPGAVTVGLVTLYLASFLAIVSDAVYRVGLDNLVNVIIALAIVTVLSFALPIYVYVRTRAVGVLAWGMTPLIISVFILYERLETLPYISQPSPGVSFLLGLFAVNPNVFGELEGSLYVLSVLGLLSPSLNVGQRWKQVVLAPLSPLSYFVVMLSSNGLQSVGAITTPLVLTMLLVAFSSVTLVVLNYVERDLLKLSAAIFVAITGFVLSRLMTEPGFLPVGLSPVYTYLGIGLPPATVGVLGASLYFGKSTQAKQTFYSKRIKLLEEINDLQNIVNKLIKDVSTLEKTIGLEDLYSKSISNIRASLVDLPNKVLSCEAPDLKCLESIEEKVVEIKKGIVRNISDLAFDVVTRNNNFVTKFKRLGIVSRTIQAPKDTDLKFETLTDFIEKLNEQVNESLLSIRNSVTSIDQALEELLGSKMVANYGDVLSLDNVVDTLNPEVFDQEIRMCTNNMRALLETVSGNEVRYELLNSVSRAALLPFSYEKVVTVQKSARKLLKVLSDEYTKEYEELEELNEETRADEVAQRANVLKDAIALLNGNDPICKRFSAVNSLLYEIKKALQLVDMKEEIKALDNLALTLGPVLQAKRAIPVSELGIKDEFVPLFISILRTKGYNVKVENGELKIEE